MTAEEFVGLLDNPRRLGARWRAKCPAHDDATPSLTVTQGTNGVLVHCWAGCETTAILDALNLEWSDLFT